MEQGVLYNRTLNEFAFFKNAPQVQADTQPSRAEAVALPAQSIAIAASASMLPAGSAAEQRIDLLQLLHISTKEG